MNASLQFVFDFVFFVDFQYAKTAKHDVPEHIQYGKLLKELIKVSRNFEVQVSLFVCLFYLCGNLSLFKLMRIK